MSLGEKVTIIDNNHLWYNVKLKDGRTKGWILSDFVLPMSPTDAPIRGGIVIADVLNFRDSPSLDGKILKSLPKGFKGIIIESKEDWHKFLLDSSLIGWVHSKYINTIPYYPKGQITADNVNLRTHPSIEGTIINQLPLNTIVDIKNYENNWYQIIYNGNKTGWVHKSYIIIKIKTINPTISRAKIRTSIKIINIAKDLLNSPYLYGAEGPRKFDCSGFTHYVFKKAGIDLPRTSSSQANSGTKISKENLQMGDLVFFDTSGKYNGIITHVGIYIDNGKFIHASSGKNSKGVVISNLTEGYYSKRFVKGVRILND